MNKKLKRALEAGFDAPKPVDKERFLKTLRYPKISYLDFLFRQLFYIRKRVWVLSAMIVLIGWAAAFLSPLPIHWPTESEKVWIVSAILPFLALLTATEIYRSSLNRMAELEISCRFSLSQIIVARTTLLGGGNFIILALLLLFVSRVSPYGLLQLIVYLMVPYLVTCGVCLMILNRMRGQEGIYSCAAAACFVCIIHTVLPNVVQLLYENASLGYWLLLLAAAVLMTGTQMRILLKHTENKFESASSFI